MIPGNAGGILVLLLLILGCEVADQAAGSVSAYDSAGVRVVVVPVRHAGEDRAWSIGASPIWSVGDRDEEPGHQLHEVVGAIRFGDGRVAVANAGSNELRFFDGNEELLSISGGAGSGPGEFSGLAGLHRIVGDSLATVDLSLRRVSVFGDRGEYTRSFNIPNQDDGSILDLVSESEEGWFLYRTLPIMGAAQVESGTARLRITLYRSDREGQGVRRLGEFPGVEILVTPMEGRPPMAGSLPFGRNAVVALARSGFLLGVADDYEIGLYDADASPVQVLRRAFEPRRVLPAHIEARRSEIREGMPDSPARRMFEGRLESAPATLPPYGSVLVDAEGILWVGRYAAPGDQTRVWDLFHLDQGMVATLEVPFDVLILEVGTDYVLAVRTDDLGVEIVEVSPLTRGG
jgi:hypothetical protein